VLLLQIENEKIAHLDKDTVGKEMDYTVALTRGNDKSVSLLA
jgi:hypothetical protein